MTAVVAAIAVCARLVAPPLRALRLCVKPACRSSHAYSLASLGLILPLLLVSLSACQPEEKVVRYHPFLANVPGAETGVVPIGPRFENRVDPTAAPADGIVIEKPDKSKILVSRSIRHLMTHVDSTLASGEDDLLFDQLISDAAKEEFRFQGKDPREIVTYLKRNHDNIRALFGRMPFAEQSPSVILEQPGNKVMHLKLTGLAAKDMKFKHLWARLEKGNWKLLWVE